MEGYTPRQSPAYPGDMTDENIRAIFDGAGDFFFRRLQCGPWTLFAYAIDGLISGGDMSEYVLRPMTEHLVAENLKLLYDAARNGMVYNCEQGNHETLLAQKGFYADLYHSQFSV